MKALCTICMRGGSKGVPGKNIRLLNGKPLMEYTIQQAIESNLFENIVISHFGYSNRWKEVCSSAISIQLY